jgi:hypothetical protein
VCTVLAHFFIVTVIFEGSGRGGKAFYQVADPRPDPDP